MRHQLLVALCACALGTTVLGLNNGVARTPPMGTNTWNSFRCNGINAANVMAVADKMVSLGLLKAGYEYLNIDDCWCTSRSTSTGRLVPDPTAFPQGMKPVADYVHGKGLKFGMYTDRGPKTCAGRPASGGHESIDAQTFADWGVDYLKEDSCNAPGDHPTAFKEYGLMRDALNATGREIVFSLCGWNSWYAPVGKTLGNSWRIAGDCNAWPSVYNAITTNINLYNYSGPGAWNDADMLVGSTTSSAVHNTPDQARTQFSLWSVFASPLLIGANLLNVSAWDLETYTNAEVIAVSQDPLGYQGRAIVNTCPHESMEQLSAYTREQPRASVPACQQIWAKKLSKAGSWAVHMVNFDTNGATITCDAACFAAMGLSTADVRDLWAHKDLGTASAAAGFSQKVGGDGASMTFTFTAA